VWFQNGKLEHQKLSSYKDFQEKNLCLLVFPHFCEVLCFVATVFSTCALLLYCENYNIR